MTKIGSAKLRDKGFEGREQFLSHSKFGIFVIKQDIINSHLLCFFFKSFRITISIQNETLDN